MKQEIKILRFSMINNLLIAILKIVGGSLFSLASLTADGLHTFSDFITDIVSMIGSKISKKRPTKYHPFGFGKVEYLSNLLVGIILFLLGIFILFESFQEKEGIPQLTVLVILGISFLLKLVSIFVMNKVGKKINSQVLITSVKESKLDLYSTILVFFITILLQFQNAFPLLKYSDMLGSLFISLLVLKTAVTILFSNAMFLIGELEEDKEKIKEVSSFILKDKRIEDAKVELIKYGSYYKLQLTIELDSNLTLREVTRIEDKLKKKLLRERSFHIKYVSIYVTNHMK